MTESEWPSVSADTRCPCQSGLAYGECCRPFHVGEGAAPTAERLMRSRYSAYVTGAREYLLATWHPSTRPSSLELDPDIRWYRLEILSRTAGGMLDTRGTVEFRASYRTSEGVGDQHETSTFVRSERRWVYLDGITR